MSNKIKKLVKKNLKTLLETKGFEHMEVAFGVKEKSDNLSDAEKKQFGSMETIQDEKGVKLGDSSVQPELNKVHKKDKQEEDEYFKDVEEKMKKFQTTSEAEPTQIGEAFDPPKVNRKDDQTEPEDVYDTEALGPGMLALRYDNEGTPVHNKFKERMDDMNGEDLTYKKLKGYGEKYLKHKYEEPDEYHYTPKVRVTESKSSIKDGVDAVVNDPEVQEKVKKLVSNLSPEQINRLQMDIKDTIDNLKNQPEVTTETDEKNKVEKAADAVEDVASGLAGTSLVLVLPVAIGAAVGSVAAGFGIAALGITGLYGISKLLRDYAENKTNENYSDVIKENIFKVKGQIKSKEQVLNLVNKLPERVRVDETVFAVTDGENYYRLIWEGMDDGEAIITHQKNINIVNESINKMKHLWEFKSSNQNKKIIKENDDVFFKMMNKVRGK